MAKTVAEIDGDSSGLVSELGKAKGAMGDLGTQGKKLSDQLKQVADDADVAAGNLINKLGGPTAIKAIAGVGLAFEGASRLAGAFLDSSEALFRSYGDEGQKVWDQTEKGLFAIKGAFAEAVLGGGSLEDMAGRLNTIFGVTKVAIDALLIPVSSLSKLVIALGENMQTTAGYVVEASDKLDLLAGKARLDGLTKTGEGIEGLKLKLMQLKGETDNLLQLEIKRDIAAAESLKNEIRATELQADALASAAAVVGAQGEIEKKAAEKQQEYIRNLGEEKLSRAQLAEARRIYNAELLLQGQAVMAQQMEQRKAMSAGNAAQIAEIDATIAGFKEVAEAKAKSTSGGGSGGKKDEPETVAEMVARVSAAATARADAANEALALKEQNDKTEQELDMQKMRDELARIDAQNAEKAAKAQAFLDFTKQMELDHIAEIHARGELTAEEQDQLNAERLQAVQDRAGQEMGIYAQVAGKQLVLGKLSAKEAADMARKQLGNVIMGLGDKAMAEAGLMAASLNPLAVPMAAAGVAAYAIGGSLSADKKGAGSTPATEKAEAAAPSSNNYAFNLRVDSVFADGESVARQFAMMQESARQRGLLQQGAY